MAHPCKHVVSKETSYISLNDSLAAMQVNSRERLSPSIRGMSSPQDKTNYTKITRRIYKACKHGA